MPGQQNTGGRKLDSYMPWSLTGSGNLQSLMQRPMQGPMQGPVQPPRTTPIAPKVNTSVPSTALTQNVTTGDVLRRRQQLEQMQATALRLQEMAKGLQSPVKPSPLTNPDAVLSRYFSGDVPESPAMQQQRGIFDRMASTTKSFFSGRDKQIQSAFDQYGVSEARDTLGETRQQIAERQVRLRNDLMALEKSPENRGVARQFAVDQRERVKADAAFELANLSIIESAQLGNLEQARTDAKALIDQQFQSFEMQIESDKMELQRLMPTLDAERQKQAMELQIALDQRQANIQSAKAVEEQKQNLIIQAASAGASQSVLNSMLKASTVEEALMLATPYMRQTQGGGGGGLTPSQMFSQVNSLRDDARNDPDIKDFVAIRDGYERVKAGAQLANGQGDLSLLFGYMKLLDPTSVVRETEFANAETAMGYVQQTLNIPSKFLKGTRLTEEGRKQYVSAAESLYSAKKQNYDRAVNFYNQSAQTFGIDSNLVLRDFTSAQAVNPTQELDELLKQADPVPEKEEKGWFKSFLNVFGL